MNYLRKLILNVGIILLRIVYRILIKTRFSELRFRASTMGKVVVYITYRFIKLMQVDQLITIGGHQIWFPCPAPALIVLEGAYERGTTNLFHSLLRQGMTVVDVGSCVGYYSLIAARLVGASGKVFSLEPEPRNFAFLLKNVELNGYKNIVCIQKAASNKTGKACLFLSNDIGSHTLFSDSQNGPSVLVETTTLDDLLTGCRVDLVKMDVEGAEADVLDGMKRVVEGHDVKLIVEFAPLRLSSPGRTADALLGKLDQLGFTVQIINDKVLKPFSMAEAFELARSSKEGAVNLFCHR